MELKVKQRYDQKNKISAKQLQDLKILQMSILEIEDLANELVETNPLVEVYYETSGYDNRNKYEEALDFVHKEVSLKDVLYEQLFYCDSKYEKEAGFIIDSLDTNGFLDLSNEELMEILRLDKAQLDEVLRMIHSFSPAGVGYRNLRECLLIQLCFADHPYDPLAIQIVYHYLELLAENKIEKLAKLLNADFEDVRKAVQHIRSLNPRPGSLYDKKSEYIIPEIFIEVVDGEIMVSISSRRPFFRIKQYTEILDKETNQYIKEKTKQAVQIIGSIEKRYDTLRQIINEIIQVQKDYFMNQGCLKPFTYQNLADRLGLNKSTICRCVKDKYVLYNGEAVSLKAFFANEAVKGISGHEILFKISEMIKNEDKKNPLSDANIARSLNHQGYAISRRTIVKYRHILMIPNSKQRKIYESE